jgi:hypothetical protein
MTLHNGSHVELWSSSADIGHRFNCEHSSYSVALCMKRYVDLNRDDGVSDSEIDAAKKKYMRWYEKLVDSIVNAGSSKDIRTRCDLNKNGKIDVDDLIAWNHRCSQYGSDAEASSHTGELCLCNCESINSISKYICDRAKG